MDQEFSVEKLDFEIIKDKIIKTDEILHLYKDKNEKYSKATHAFKQLKTNYETTIHETNRLKMDNDHLKYSLQSIKSKYEEQEKELRELKSDYNRLNERYEKNMIESQLSISELEEKVQHCSCKSDITMSPSKKNTKENQIKELKQFCKDLQELEIDLKKQNESLLLKNSEIVKQNSRNKKMIEDISAKNEKLQKEIKYLNNMVKAMEFNSKELEITRKQISSLRENHDKELNTLKMEIYELRIEDQRIKDLELECEQLRKQKCNRESNNEMVDSAVQTEESFESELRKNEISASHLKCENVQNKFDAFETCSNKDFGVQTNIQISEVNDDMEDVDEILREMILPRLLSPLDVLIVESPPCIEDSTIEPKTLPNIIITPPTPNLEKLNSSESMFSIDCTNTDVYKETTVCKPGNPHEEGDVAVQETDKNDLSNVCVQELNTVLDTGQKEDIQDRNDESILKTCQNNDKLVSEIRDLEENGKYTSSELKRCCERIDESNNSCDTGKKLFNTDLLNNSFKSTEMASEGKSKLHNVRTLKRRKILIPYSKDLLRKVSKQHRKIRRCKKIYSEENDTILSALKTLQRNKINFTISNASIPLLQPHNCCSVASTQKLEPQIRSTRQKNTFCHNLSCWNNKCNINNTQMLLRNILNEEEPELLGFFSVKDEKVVAPTSVPVSENKNPNDSQEIVVKILDGIKEMFANKTKESLQNKRKKNKRIKSKLSEFYSETETELENLFRSSEDVLERNRKLLATAKNQNVTPNEDSVHEFESDMMIDSGLVSGTPKLDTDSLGCCSQNEEENSTKHDTLNSVHNVNNSIEERDILHGFNENVLKDKPSGYNHYESSSSKKSLDRCTTPNYSTCPDMLSPLASSKGSPESLQIASTPLKAQNSHLEISPCFKTPFCPTMISPLASSQSCADSPCMKVDMNESTDFLISSCPVDEKLLRNTEIYENSRQIYNLQTLNDPKLHSLCQKLTFDIDKNDDKLFSSLLDHDYVKPIDKFGVNRAVEDQPSTFMKTPENMNKFDINHSKKEDESSFTLPPFENSFGINFSLKSSDLNCTLDDVSFSQLEGSSVLTNEDSFTSTNVKSSSLENSLSNNILDNNVIENKERYSLIKKFDNREDGFDESITRSKRRLSSSDTDSPNHSLSKKIRDGSRVQNEVIKANITVETSTVSNIFNKQEQFNQVNTSSEKMILCDLKQDIASTSKNGLDEKICKKVEEIEKGSKISTDQNINHLLESDFEKNIRVNREEIASKIPNVRTRRNVKSNKYRRKDVFSNSESESDDLKKTNEHKNIVPHFNESRNKNDSHENLSAEETKSVYSENKQIEEINSAPEKKVIEKVGDIENNVCEKKNDNYENYLEPEKEIMPFFLNTMEKEPIKHTPEDHLVGMIADVENIKTNLITLAEMKSPVKNIGEHDCKEPDFSVSSDVSYEPTKSTLKTNLTTSQYDLFGDISDLDDQPSDLNKIKMLPKHGPDKNVKKQGRLLMKKVLNQVKGTVYNHYLNKTCNNSKIAKDVKVPKTSVTADSNVSKNDMKKIRIVENILISKGQTINLLTKDEKNGQGQELSVKWDEKVEISREPSPTVSKPKILRTYSRKRSKLEQKISNNTTPVDILSQVMHGMVKNGPKAQVVSKPLNSAIHEKPPLHDPPIYDIVNEKVNQNQMQVIHGLEDNAKIDNVEKTNLKYEEILDGPKSPDVLEMPDCLPRLIPTEKPVKLPPSKVRFLMDKLLVFSNESKMLDDVINEFAFQDVTYIIDIILDKLSRDYHDKPDNLLPPSPPMTSSQRILLGFLLRLDRSTHPGIREKFLRQAELRLFNRNICTLEKIQPITRVITALYKLKYDLNRIRRFICEAFYFMGDFAIPMFFTLLTMWPEALPMESETSDKLLGKVIVQICYLKECNEPGYNILPLRDLLHKYYGYPTERWNCEDIFTDVIVEYIRNPAVRISDFTLLIFLKNKPVKWVHQKIKNHIIPLFEKTSDSNPNLKATLLILLANICCGFQKYEDYDWSVILEMDQLFLGLENGDNSHPIIRRSIHLARARLPRRATPKKRNKSEKLNVEDSPPTLQSTKDNTGAVDSSSNTKNSESTKVTVNIKVSLDSDHS